VEAQAGHGVPDDDLAYLRQFLPSETEERGEVLVVDDYAENREVLARLLERRGYTVTTAASGDEALGLLHARLGDRPFELLLLDIVMPGVNGWEVLQRVKSDDRLEELPVIMISGLDEVDAVVRCLELGATDFVAKPFEPAILRARVNASLEAKRARDRERLLYEELRKRYGQLREYVASEEV
jgi:DNA-binding response OmpR family regulator